MRVLVGAAGLEAPPVAASAVEDEEDEDEDQDEGDEGGEASASSPSEQAETLARVGAELSSRGAWQARCCLLLWLAHVSTVPFPMALLDASFEAAAGGGGGGDDENDDDDGGSDEEEGGETAATSSSSWPPLAAAAQAAAVSSLSSPGADRDSAVLALGRLLSRPDAKGRPLRSFARWACSRVTENASGRRRSPSSSSSSLAALGSVEALAQLFARAERGALAEVGPLAWQAAAALLLPQQKGEGGSGSGSSPSALPGVHARRAAAKLASRIAMSVMPPLLMSQQPSPSSLPPPPSSSEASSSQQQQQQHRQLRLPAPLSPTAAATAEDVANALLAALRDRDTAVRWAAAKGVSRLAARLPRREDASALLRRCAGPLLSGSDAGDDAAWHGSALALASLARAAAASAGAAGGGSPSSPSLLISTRADARAVATGAAAALSYEVRRGERSVGSHVRDAGAYVAWALARCAAAVVGRGEGEGGEEEEGNESEDKTGDGGDGGGGDGLPLTTRSLARALRPLGPLLLSVSCFDREVNCRRAAAAAFQEGAGRLPPEGKKKEKEEGAGATSDEAETEAEAETGGAFARSLDAVRVGAADFFTLGSRSRAALVAGPAAARLDASYALAAVEALVGRGVGGRGGAAAAAAAAGKAKAASASTCRGKLWHWERATRELSARALAQVLRSAVESGWCEEGDAKAKAEEGEEREEKKKKQKKKSPLCPCPSAVAALLLEECGIGASSSSPSSSEPEKRHGALCALAELLGEFKEEEAEKKDDDDGQGTSTSCSSSSSISFLPLDDATLVATAAIPLSFSKLVKGRGGEMVREAAMRLVAARARRASSVLSSRSPAPPSALPRQQQQQPGAEAAAAALAAVGECLRHPSEAVRSSAAEALSCLARASSSSSSSSSPSSSSSSSSSSFDSVSLLSESLPRWIRWLSNVNGAGSSGGGGGGSGSGSDGAARAGGAAALGALFGGSESGGELLRSLLPVAPEALRALQAACRLEPDPANRVAEARAAAARALPLVAARVAAASRSSPQSSSSSSYSSLPDSIGALLDASADYSTDKRGDVGSWVRGPASKGATELLLLLAAGEGEHEAAAKALAPHVARALARQASERCGRLRGEARDSLRSLLLKAGGEFLPDAGLLAEAVRAADEAHSSSVAVAAALEDGGGDDGDGGNGEGRGLHHLHSRHHAHHHHHRHHHHGGGDDATLALAASLLRIPSYAQEAAAGLAACAGGLDAPLARAAGRALCSAATCASSAADSGPGSSSASAAVVRALVAAWASASSLGEEARLTTPFLKAADALLCGIGEEGAAAGGGGEGAAAGGADEALCAAADPSDPASSPSLAQAMLDLTLAACRRCRDPARLCAASALLCHLAGVDGRGRGGGAEGRGSGGGERAAAAAAVVGRRATAARALRAAASLTGHCYPTVRRAAADNLSLRLLMGIPVVDGDGEGEGKDGRESERARAAVWRESGSSSGGGGGGTGGGEKGEEQEEVETLARRPDAAAASDLLSETAWDAATPSARAARARLFELLGLPAPGGDAAAGAEEAAAERAAEAQRQSKVGGGGGGVSAAATTTASSSSGYQSLIDAVSRGGAD